MFLLIIIKLFNKKISKSKKHTTDYKPSLRSTAISLLGFSASWENLLIELVTFISNIIINCIPQTQRHAYYRGGASVTFSPSTQHQQFLLTATSAQDLLDMKRNLNIANCTLHNKSKVFKPNENSLDIKTNLEHTQFQPAHT